MPKQKGDTKKETFLAIWLTKQLCNHRSGKLSEDQQAQLRKIPAISQFFSVQGKSIRLHFALRCKSIEDWCAHHGGSLPKTNGDTQEERSLANLLMYKLRRYHCGKLSDNQLATLRTIPEVANMFESNGT